MSEAPHTIETMDERSRIEERLVDADLIDERFVMDVDSGFDLPPTGIDSAGNHAAAMSELEWAAIRARVAAAEQYRVIAEVIRDARDEPDLWAGPDPTLDSMWVDPRGRSAAAVRRDRRDMAARSAAADIAVRLTLAETTVQARAAHAETLRERCPRVWAVFLGGGIAEANAITTAQLAVSLPDDPQSWAQFDARVLGPAGHLTPGCFRTSARAVRERVHAESLDDRHRRAVADRGVWLMPELDGMTTMTAFLPAPAAAALMTRLDAAARHLKAADDEERTLAQLRADVLCDLALADAATGDDRCPVPGSHAGSCSAAGSGTGSDSRSASGAPRVSVAITIPVLSLLGASDEPATLDGYGPIDLDTAKKLAGEARSWIRVLTHPVTSTVLDVDRTSYRVPADLRRWLGVRHPTCVFPGCSRSSDACDLDHSIDWGLGGATASDNLAPLCRSHHRVKHESAWTLGRDDGSAVWTSPTGFTASGDPPPF